MEQATDLAVVEQKVKEELAKTVNLPAVTAEARNIIEQAGNLVEVADDSTQDVAIGLLDRIKNMEQNLERYRKEITTPMTQRKKWIDSFFAALIVPLQPVNKGLADKIAVYRAALEHKRQIQEEKERKARAVLEAEAKKKGEPVFIPPVIQQAAAKKVTTENGAAVTFAKYWTFSVVDLAKVPRDFLVLDKAKVDAQIKAGARDISGLTIFQAEKMSRG